MRHEGSGRTVGYGSLVAEASALDVPRDVPLKDPKAFRIIGQRLDRLDNPDKVRGAATFGLDVRIAWHGLRQRGALAGVRWPGGHGGGRSGGARGVRRAGRGAARRSGGGRGRALLAGREGAARAHGALGRGHRGRSRQRGNPRPTHGAARGLRGNGRTAGGRCGVVAVRGGGADHRPLRRTVPGARHDGADELHGLGARRSGGSVGSDPVPDGPVDGQRWRLARGSGQRRRGLDRSGDHQHDLSWRRLRSSARGGLRGGGRAGRQGSGPSGAGHLVSRRRRAARLLPADHRARTHGHTRRGWHAGGVAPADRLPGDHPRLAAALDPGLVAEPHGHPRARRRALRRRGIRRHALRRAKPPGGLAGALRARAGGVLALGGPLAEFVRDRELHRRAGRGGGPGSGGLPPGTARR